VEGQTISIKGLNGKLLVTLGPGRWDAAVQLLYDQIEDRGEFFRGAVLVLQVGDHTLDSEDIRKLQARLAAHDVKLSTLLGTSPETIRSARRMELETRLEDDSLAQQEAPARELPPIDVNQYGSEGVLVKATLRSGRVVQHGGHVVVIGDVNPGSQIIAGGDVIVWGRLRGSVTAGASGDADAVVCALDLRPAQLRIAGLVALAADDGKPRPKPEIAFIRQGQIVADDWMSVNR